jgi:spore coat-associated protein N
MKKAKNILLGTTLAGAIIATAGVGTYSWFTSETEAQGSMENGTLEINNGENIEEALFSGVKFAPSQLQYGDWVSITNTGDMDTILKASYMQAVDKAALEKYDVGYMAMKYTVEPGKDVYEDSKIKLENLFNGATNERSVMKNTPKGVEVVGKVLSKQEAESGEIQFGEGDQGDDSFWKLEEGQYIDIMVGIKLDESAGNEYQGATYDATLKVNAKQTDEGATYE